MIRRQVKPENCPERNHKFIVLKIIQRRERSIVARVHAIRRKVQVADPSKSRNAIVVVRWSTLQIVLSARPRHKCRKCDKIGHLEKVCKSLRKFAKNVQHVAEDSDTADPDDHLSVCQIWSRKKGIYAVLEIEGISVSFLIDTGSSVSILAEDLYKRHFSKVYPLTSTSVQLLDYSKSAIPIQGCFIAAASFHGRCTSILLYVVPGGTTILGLDGIAALDMKIQG